MLLQFARFSIFTSTMDSHWIRKNIIKDNTHFYSPSNNFCKRGYHDHTCQVDLSISQDARPRYQKALMKSRLSGIPFASSVDRPNMHARRGGVCCS